MSEEFRGTYHHRHYATMLWSDMLDRNLRCRQCGCDFIFTASEQKFYSEKGLKNEPRRCARCRAAGAPPFVRSEVTCAQCGGRASVPFRPSQNRPVFCRACYRGIAAATPSEVIG